MHDPDTMIWSWGPFSLWHRDPCKKGYGDDTCGWFMRAEHGDPELLKGIERDIAFDFDRVYVSESPPHTIYPTGLFKPDGTPNYSVSGIVINMFFIAIHRYYGYNWKKSNAWMSRNLFEIMRFAENPTDSLRDMIVQTFGPTTATREERIHRYAGIVYGWILRQNRPWYKHPRWHIHHWRFECAWFRRMPQGMGMVSELRASTHEVNDE